MKRWTPEQIEILRSLWPTAESMAVLGAEIGRVKNAVRSQARRLGLAMPRLWARIPRWTPEQNATLTRLWDAGLTGSQIGREMGKTRNAIIGRAHRLNLPGRHKPERSPMPERKRKAVRKPAQTRKPEMVLPEPKTVSAPSLPVSVAPIPKPEPQGAFWMKRREGTECSWIAVDPKSVPIESLRCCGATKRYGLPFCDTHMARAFQKKAA